MSAITERDPKSREEIRTANPITETCSIGSYLASRLEEIGVKHHFAVAGDYNLVLLEQLLLNKNIQQVYCCNELNCSFAAEGYPRANGVAVCVATFSVGSLTAFDGLAGAYAEELFQFLVNNRGYTIEVEIHDGPYNIGLRATTGGELAAPIDRSPRFPKWQST